MEYYDEQGNHCYESESYVDEREDEDGRLDSWANHQSMVEACEDNY